MSSTVRKENFCPQISKISSGLVHPMFSQKTNFKIFTNFSKNLPIDQMLGVNILHHMQELNSNEQHSAQGKFSSTNIKEIF